MATESQLSGASLFNSPVLSDVKIKQNYKGKMREYYAHKAILARGSRFFLKAFTDHFKEASDSVIEVYDDVPEHFEIVLKFLYTLHYDVDAISKLGSGSSEERVILPIKVLVVGDKYDIEVLPKLIGHDVEAVLLKLPFSQTLAAAIKAYYPTCNKAGSPTGTALTRALFKYRSSFVQSEWIGPLLEQHPAFGADVALYLHKQGRLRC